MSALLLLAVVAVSAEPAADAWKSVEHGAQIAAAVQPSPLFATVQAQERHADPLLDEDIAASLDAVRAYQQALDALDAAVATAKCTLPKDVDAASVLRLADAALVTALADGADKHPSRAAGDVVRAADLAALVGRCGKPDMMSAALAIGIAEHARPVAWFLAEQRLVDDKGLVRIAQGLAPTAVPALLERALEGERARLGRGLNLDEQRAVSEIGARLDALIKDQALLGVAASDFEHISRPEHVVIVKCDAASSGAAEGADQRFTVTRAVAHALERKRVDSLANDSVVSPSLDGRGVLVVSAGPVARSCGFVDGDLV
ncbi:MAG TPA: hypothetical protein VGO62_16125, partial [Myxococcota bacterium]